MRCASVVVKRSSQVSTGTCRRSASRSAKSRASAACGPSSPERLTGRPTTTVLGLLLCDKPRDLAEPALGAGIGDGLERRRERPGRVADRAAAAGAAVVERQDAGQAGSPSFASIALRARSRAPRRASPGLRPPACAIVSRPPPPPPITAARPPSRRRPRTGRARPRTGVKLATSTRPPVAGRAEHDRRVAEARLEPVGQLAAARRVPRGRSAAVTTFRPSTSAACAGQLRRELLHAAGAARLQLALELGGALQLRLDRAHGVLGAGAQARRRSASSASSRARSRRTASGPVTASMRRTFAALDPSLMILKTPISEVLRRACLRTARARRPRPRSRAPRRRTSRRTAPSRPSPPPACGSCGSRAPGGSRAIHSFTWSSIARSSSRATAACRA